MLKLTSKSPAKLLLKQKFIEGKLTGDENPKDVWESEEVFKKHKLSNFRTHYNRMRLEFKSGTLLSFCSNN